MKSVTQRRRQRSSFALAGLVGLVGCHRSGSPTDPPASGAVFRVRVCVSTALPAGESFRIQLDDPARIAQAAALVGAGHRKVVTGRTRSGDGGVNGGWHWHLAPESIEFVDAAIEVCDGCPHDLEGNPAYWIDQLGRYCPFSSEIVARER